MVDYDPLQRIRYTYPMTNVVPFTYRDGVTYQQLLYQAIEHINLIITSQNQLGEAVTEDLEEMQQQLALMQQEMDDLVEETQRWAADTEILQDQAVSTLVQTDDPASLTRAALDDLYKRSFLGEDGKRYVVVAGVIRRENGEWGFIDDGGHPTINCLTVTEQNTNTIRISFADLGQTKINTFIVAPDEALAKMGFTVGATVNATHADIQGSRKIEQSGILYKSSGTWAIDSNSMTVGTVSGNSVQVLHESMQPESGQKYINTSFTVAGGAGLIRTINQATAPDNFTISFYDPDTSATVAPADVPEPSSTWVVRSGRKILVHDDYEIAFANLWFHGVFELPDPE